MVTPETNAWDITAPEKKLLHQWVVTAHFSPLAGLSSPYKTLSSVL